MHFLESLSSWYLLFNEMQADKAKGGLSSCGIYILLIVYLIDIYKLTPNPPTSSCDGLII